MAGTSRIEFFLERLEHPKNAYAKSLMPKWYNESLNWAHRMMELHEYHKTGSTIEGLRTLYICNHMCPNLAHLKTKPLPPAPSYIRREPEALREYQRMLHEYEYENTQATLANSKGEVVQDGIHQTKEEFELIKQYVERMCAA